MTPSLSFACVVGKVGGFNKPGLDVLVNLQKDGPSSSFPLPRPCLSLSISYLPLHESPGHPIGCEPPSVVVVV